jgi:hypothetical protein
MPNYKALISNDFKLKIVDVSDISFDQSEYFGYPRKSFKSLLSTGFRRYTRNDPRNNNLSTLSGMHLVTYVNNDVEVCDFDKLDGVRSDVQYISRQISNSGMNMAGDEYLSKKLHGAVSFTDDIILNPNFTTPYANWRLIRNAPSHNCLPGWVLYQNVSYGLRISLSQGIQLTEEGTLIVSQNIPKESILGSTYFKIKCDGATSLFIGTSPMVLTDGFWEVTLDNPATTDLKLSIVLSSLGSISSVSIEERR